MPQPIDAVITWVDGSDPVLRAKQKQFFQLDSDGEVTSQTRFADCNEIYYCIAAILKNAPFINRIFIVTDNQRPGAIDDIAKSHGQAAADKIHVVDHKDIFDGYLEYLPTFNSPAIETMLHRIPDLSERYIYFNDDVFVVNRLKENDFFNGNRPVLRGRYRDAKQLSFSRRQRARKIAGKRSFRGKLFSYKETQYLGSRLVCDNETYFWHDHTTHPFYRPDLEQYFSAHDDVLRQNIQFRIRDASQFDTMSLANALDIQKGNANFRPIGLTYFKATEKLFKSFYIWRKRRHLKKNKSDFLCLQSLNELPDNQRIKVIAWLDELIFGQAKQ